MKTCASRLLLLLLSIAIPVMAEDGDEAIANRQWQGIPGLEKSPKGRIFVSWFTGGSHEPAPENLVLLCYSDDGGKTFTKPKAMGLPSDDGTRCFDPTLWIDPAGRLWYIFNRGNKTTAAHDVWARVCEDPDATPPVFGDEFRVGFDEAPFAFRMNKPTVLSSGEWVLPVTLAQEEIRDWFAGPKQLQGVAISNDQGRTWKLHGAVKAPEWALENMIVELKDGRLWMLIRTGGGVLWESFSTDKGLTWSEGKATMIESPGSRFFIRRLASGNLLLVNHHKTTWRSRLTARLSTDDGKMWNEGLLLDERGISYPDGVEDENGLIWITYDRGRTNEGLILLARFREEDVVAGKDVSGDVLLKYEVDRLREPEPVAETIPDRSEDAKKWSFQSYWQDASIEQAYRFSTNTDDRIVGAASVLVDFKVGAEKRSNRVELRMEPESRLDLSNAEAIEISLKHIDGTVLNPADLYLCNPGFQKLAVHRWPQSSADSQSDDWRRCIFDLSDGRVTDKAKPGEEGEYDLSDVETLCLNFSLPEGPVEGRMLIDGIRVAKLPPPEVVLTKLEDGSFSAVTSEYEAVVGSNGYLQSLNAGKTSFLRTMESGIASACFVDNQPEKGIVPLSPPILKGRAGLKAAGKQASVVYDFRKEDFDITIRQSFTTAGWMKFALSPEVVAALDGRTDRQLLATDLEQDSQIDTRLVTSTGGVLACKQYMEGYSRMGTTVLPEDVWAYQFLAYGASPQKLTLRPIGNPGSSDAVGVRVECRSPDFLLPGGEPVRFDLTATNYSSESVKGSFNFEIRDYLTHEPVAHRTTEFELQPGAAMPVPTDVVPPEPGPYRGVLTVSDGQHERTIEWVFTYDFANYKPEIERPDDFHAFWKNTLEELAAIPMDAQVTPAPDVSTEELEAFKVSLATLGGRRVHCWYWKPMKPGKYPAQFEVPSSGVYPRQANQVPRGTNRVGMWMAIHGLPVDFDPANRPEDEAAWNYWTHGIESPEASMWRTIYASLVRGVDFLTSREEVDAERIMVSGGSQGGGLTMVLAGLDQRITFAAPAHSGLARLDWTVLHKPGFWPFDLSAKPDGQTTEQFLKTLSYFDAANFTPDITCPVFAEVSLLDTVTASGNQICALSHVRPGLLELVCDPWKSHASSPRGQQLRSQAINRWLKGEPPLQKPIKASLPSR